MSLPRIGIVDDDAGMRDALCALLKDYQFDPFPMECSADFTVVQKSTKLDLVLIDLKLRDESGLELAREIRRKDNLPIVMLTGRGDETDKIIGLEVGADDYVLKPFNPRELVARIKAVLRRTLPAQSAIALDPALPDPIHIGHLTLDPKQRVLYNAHQEEIVLTNAEYRLLEKTFA